MNATVHARGYGSKTVHILVDFEQQERPSAFRTLCGKDAWRMVRRPAFLGETQPTCPTCIEKAAN